MDQDVQLAFAWTNTPRVDTSTGSIPLNLRARRNAGSTDACCLSTCSKANPYFESSARCRDSGSRLMKYGLVPRTILHVGSFSVQCPFQDLVVLCDVKSMLWDRNPPGF